MSRKYVITATCFDKRGRVLASAVNDYTKSNPWQKELSVISGMSDQRIYLHSEIAALLKCRGKEVYLLKVERYNKEGKPMMAFPCPSCQIGIKISGVKKVLFTTEEGFKEWTV